jgi:hypothetical protein
VSQLAGATRRRRPSLRTVEQVAHERFWGPIWETSKRPAHLDHGCEAGDDEAAGEDGSGGSLFAGSGGGTVQAIDPVDAARVALFCMGYVLHNSLDPTSPVAVI